MSSQEPPLRHGRFKQSVSSTTPRQKQNINVHCFFSFIIQCYANTSILFDWFRDRQIDLEIDRWTIKIILIHVLNGESLNDWMMKTCIRNRCIWTQISKNEKRNNTITWMRLAMYLQQFDMNYLHVSTTIGHKII